MTVSVIKSENVTNVEAGTTLDKKRGIKKVIIDQDAIPTTSLDEVGDIILFGTVPSNAIILDISVLNDDLDSNGTPLLAADIGLYYGTGVVIDADCFGTAVTTFRAASTTWTSLRFEAADVIGVKKEAWEVAGLTVDPGGEFYVGITITAAAATAAAGDIVMRIDYI